MSLDPVLHLLRCPTCADGLRLDAGRVLCARGHSFDVARQGYVNLLGGPEPANADSAAMLDARARVQAAGVFAPVTDLLGSLTHGRTPLLDAGAGTGHYLAAALGRDPAACGLAVDVSRPAARRCAGIDPRIGAVVADVWQGLPVADRSVEVVLSVFAPRNVAEFARVLQPDGRLVVISPRPDHLAELRDGHDLLDIPADKAEHLVALAAEFFDLVDTRVVKYRVEVTAGQATDLIAMGPNAFHGVPADLGPTSVGIDVTVQSFRPLGS